ncbi:MAG: chemotaxis response regulator protein-glutamate methylesterase [Pseudomonadota bacterium]
MNVSAPQLASAQKTIRVGVVDDSAVMRAMIRKTLEAAGGFAIVGEAGDPYEARAMIKATSPDVVTLDIEMPRMSGLEFLEKIMTLRPMPVIMVSTLTASGTDATIEALARGAVDCVVKPGPEHQDSFASLPRKVRAAASARLPSAPVKSARTPLPKGRRYNRLIAIGASTGGVDALLRTVPLFPADAPPTVIVQHMPRAFTTSFAERLNARSAVTVSEAKDGDVLKSGHVYLAPGSDSHLTITPGEQPRCRLVSSGSVSGHRPSVDVLFQSLCKNAPRVVGCLLTGMGRDGADGLKALCDLGCPTVVQDEDTSVVFGMPRAAWQAGACEQLTPIDAIAEAILGHAAGRMVSS